MRCARYEMSPEQAPPGFWRSQSQRAVVEGVELESTVPTRFFQSLDAHPQEWGRLVWRVQLNRIEDGRITLPVYRTFYPGVEWNLRGEARRWFLSAWLLWQGPGPPSHVERPPSIENDTIAFCVSGTVFLRCRVDARDRRSIARSVRSQNVAVDDRLPGVISLDDLIESSHERSGSKKVPNA